METFLADKVALVTGASRGIGAATAVALAKAGADVAIAARTAEALEQTAEDVRAQGRETLAIPVDVSQRPAVEELVWHTLKELGTIDILINNAGVLQPVGDTWELDPESWEYNVQVNLNGAFFATRAALPRMIEQGSGRIINVSTGAARRPIPGWSAYSAAKAGLDHFTRVLAVELGGTGVTVNAAAPGVVDTEMQATIRQLDEGQFRPVEQFRQYKEEGVLRDPSEPAQMLLWLCHPATQEMNGELLHINDVGVRRRIADDLGVPMMSGR